MRTPPKCSPADRVIDHVYTAHPGEPAHLTRDVASGVPDDGVDADGGRSDHFNDGARPQTRAAPVHP